MDLQNVDFPRDRGIPTSPDDDPAGLSCTVMSVALVFVFILVLVLGAVGAIAAHNCITLFGGC